MPDFLIVNYSFKKLILIKEENLIFIGGNGPAGIVLKPDILPV